MADENVIEIRPGIIVDPGMPGADESPLSQEGRECRHDRSWLKHDTREVVCKQCGAKLDAFDRLRDIARDWDRYAGWVRHAQAERYRLEDEVKALKRERANLRAQIRRAKR